MKDDGAPDWDVIKLYRESAKSSDRMLKKLHRRRKRYIKVKRKLEKSSWWNRKARTKRHRRAYEDFILTQDDVYRAID